MVTVGVAEEEDLGGNRGEDAVSPRQYARDLMQPIGEDRVVVDDAIAVSVFEKLDAAAGPITLDVGIVREIL